MCSQEGPDEAYLKFRVDAQVEGWKWKKISAGATTAWHFRWLLL